MCEENHHLFKQQGSSSTKLGALGTNAISSNNTKSVDTFCVISCDKYNQVILSCSWKALGEGML